MERICVSLNPHYQHLWKKLYRFGQRRMKALSAPTQRNTLRDQNPKGQLWPWAVLCCGVLSVSCTDAQTDVKTSHNTNVMPSIWNTEADKCSLYLSYHYLTFKNILIFCEIQCTCLVSSFLTCKCKCIVANVSREIGAMKSEKACL